MLWLLMTAVALAVPLVTANTYYLYLAMTIAIMVIVTSGLNILAGLAGQISLGHAGLYAIGAYTGALLATRLGLGLWSALPLAVAVTATVGALLALAALRVAGPYLAMVTIAFGIIVESVAVEWVELTGGPGGIFNIPKPTVAGSVLPLRGYYLVVAAAAALALLATRNTMRSGWGRAFIAVKDSDLAAESLGLSTYALRTAAFTLSAAFAGAAGCLFAFLQGYVSPDSFTLQTSILFLLIVLFGGLGTLAGPVVGGIALVLLPELLRQLLDYRLIIYGALLLFSVYYLPNGVVGAFRGLGSRRARWARAIGWRPPTLPTVLEPESTTSPSTAGARPSPSEPVIVSATASAPVIASAASGEPVIVSVLARDSAATNPGPMLEITGVSVAFGGLHALADVRLVVTPGTIHSLIGPNGAGKTTLVNLVSGFYRPDRGAIVFRGERVEGRSPVEIARRGLVRTFQTPQLFDDLTVIENVMVGVAGHRLGSLPGALAGRTHRESDWRAEAERLVTTAGLDEWAHEAARRLPFGLRRRLEVARALGARPSMLLLDEPAAGLAPSEMVELNALLARLRGDGLTVLLVEHHVELVMSVSDRITVLDEGRVIADGPPREVQRAAAVIEAYLGST